MSPSRPFIERPVATALLMVGLLLVGGVAYRELPVSALPEVDYPTIQVVTYYPGASPEVMASSVTTPLERQFGEVPGLNQMTSISSAGSSIITLQFVLSLNIDVAEQEVQAAINASSNFLPVNLPNPPIYNKIKPADVLKVGDKLEARILKVDPGKKRISLGLKQLQPHPWDLVADKYKAGERVKGSVTRVTDFGAFVELEKGIEGLVHLSEMSWSKKVRKPSDVVNPGDTVDVVVLGVNAPDRRISLGLKQALGDPWAGAAEKSPVGSVVEGPVTSIQKFGAFVQVAEGVEGMVHVGDVSAEKRINHPQDVLHAGQVVKAQVLELDVEKRRLRLGMRQLIPTSLDEYIAEHKEGDVVTGDIFVEAGGNQQIGRAH